MWLKVVQLNTRHDVDADGHVLVVVAVPAQVERRDALLSQEYWIKEELGAGKLSSNIINKFVAYFGNLLIHQLFKESQIKPSVRHTAGETIGGVLEATADKNMA